jgi:NAD(P)-dependent dehydrogenase (short-subunit alcohol dehydrogenase family)
MIIDRRSFLKYATTLSLAAVSTDSRADSPPVSGFRWDTTAEQATAGIDLHGKTVVVTGCNSGIGYETMRVLALRGAHVIGTARSAEKARAACSGVVGRVTPAVLELSDFDSVAACTQRIRSMDVPIDVLICNAGLMHCCELQLVRGLELQFVVNHLGHFILANRLLDRIIAAPQGRVVVVGSSSHEEAPEGGIQFDNLSGKGWERWSYGHSKLANGLFSLELASRLRNTRATSNSLHPGGVTTGLLRYFNITPPSVPGLRAKTPAEGAATSCYLASNPALARVSGYYFVDCNAAATQSEHQTDAAMAAKLWKVSEQLTSGYLT